MLEPLGLTELARIVGGQLSGGSPGAQVTGAAIDSRRVRPGDLFVALPGERVDGHDFVGAAAEAGAAAALVVRRVDSRLAQVLVADPALALGKLGAWHRRRFDIPVVGITGSVGKTTTRAMVAAALSPRFTVLVSEANYNTELGVPLTLLRLREGHTAAVLELAMRAPGEIAYLAGLTAPRIGVVTNIGPTHMELLGSLKAIARAKGELIEALPPAGLAVLNGDDPLCRGLAGRGPAPVVLFGTGADATVRACDIRPRGAAGVDLRLCTPAGETGLRLPWPGGHNALNAAAAVAVALQLGVPLAEAAQALSAVMPQSGRLCVRALGDITLIDDSYNASPASTLAALTVLADVAAGRRQVAILGDMLELGSASEAGHEEVGRAAARGGVELLVVVGERSLVTARAAVAAGLDRSAVHWAPDQASAAQLAGGQVRSGDVVLVKGSRAIQLEYVVAKLAKVWGGTGG